MQVKNEFVDRRRNLGENMNKGYSIYNQCRECVGWESDAGTVHDEVARCTHEKCSLWPYRLPKAQIKASYARIYAGGTLGYHLNRISEQWGSKYDRTAAIRGFCGDCVCIQPGQRRDAVKECCSPQCHLYEHRG